MNLGFVMIYLVVNYDFLSDIVFVGCLCMFVVYVFVLMLVYCGFDFSVFFCFCYKFKLWFFYFGNRVRISIWDVVFLIVSCM